jgi:hypothetical protein
MQFFSNLRYCHQSYLRYTVSPLLHITAAPFHRFPHPALRTMFLIIVLAADSPLITKAWLQSHSLKRAYLGLSLCTLT